MAVWHKRWSTHSWGDGISMHSTLLLSWDDGRCSDLPYHKEEREPWICSLLRVSPWMMGNSGRYVSVKPVDMFGRTTTATDIQMAVSSHVETVCLLSNRKCAGNEPKSELAPDLGSLPRHCRKRERLSAEAWHSCRSDPGYGRLLHDQVSGETVK